MRTALVVFYYFTVLITQSYSAGLATITLLDEFVYSGTQYISITRSTAIGTIPSELGNYSILGLELIGNTGLYGTLPSELGRLTGMGYLKISKRDSYYDMLSGPIPSELGRMQRLSVLDLSNHEFSGTIPSEIGRLTTLSYLNFGSNVLSGLIPSELGRLTSISLLNISVNSISGNIPSEFARINSRVLVINENSLSLGSNIYLSDICNKIDICYLTLITNSICWRCTYPLNSTPTSTPSKSQTPSTSQIPSNSSSKTRSNSVNPSRTSSQTSSQTTPPSETQTSSISISLSTSPIPSVSPSPAGIFSDILFTDTYPVSGEIKGQIKWSWTQYREGSIGFIISWASNSTKLNKFSSIGTTEIINQTFFSPKQYSFTIDLVKIPLDANQFIFEVKDLDDNIVAHSFYDFIDLTPLLSQQLSNSVAAVSSVVVVGAAIASSAGSTSGTATVVVTTTGGTTGASTGVGTGNAGANIQASQSSLSVNGMVNQYQFLAATSYQTGNYPQGYRDFSSSFVWSHGNVGFPYSEGSNRSSQSQSQSQSLNQVDQQTTVRRQLNGIDKPISIPSYQSYTSEQLLTNTLVLFCFLLATLLLLFISYLFLKHNYKDKLPALLTRKLIRGKILSILIRIVSMAYFPVTFVSFYQLYAGTSPAMNFCAVVSLVLFTLAFPLFGVGILRRKSKIQKDNEKKKIVVTKREKEYQKMEALFRPLFEDYKSEFHWFSLVVLLKMLLNALILVFLAGVPEVQNYLMIILCGSYLILLFVNPFRLQLNARMEKFNSIANVLTLIVPIIFQYIDLGTDVDAIQWIILALQVCVIIMYLLIGLYTLNKLLKQLQQKLLTRRGQLSRSEVKQRTTVSDQIINQPPPSTQSDGNNNKIENGATLTFDKRESNDEVLNYSLNNDNEKSITSTKKNEIQRCYPPL